MRSHPIALAAVPALLCSLCVLRIGSAPTRLLLLQVAAACAAFLAAHAAARALDGDWRRKADGWLLLGLALLAWIPLLGDAAESPRRWTSVLGIQLYVAPVLLPTFLLLWQRAAASNITAPVVLVCSATLLATGLLLQPDAPQLTAFTLGCTAALRRSHLRWATKTIVLLGVVTASALAWMAPDPLNPVPYVEGVFSLAGSHSLWAFAICILAAAIPVLVLAWLDLRAGRTGTLGVSVYFACLFLLAPLQVTPVPLLGLGAGPVIGYFVMASLAMNRNGGVA